MKSTIYIPAKCKAGFKEEDDTYNGLLGYVIYHDGKKWRKEPSWDNWREHEVYTPQPDYLRDENGKVIYDEVTGRATYAPQPLDVIQPQFKPLEFDNVPTEGFVLNKKVGGEKGYSSWDVRATKTRVYDPRGFEIEISIPNLLYILCNANCMKGKGLEGKFVYGWDGTELVLIPEEAPEFSEMKDFTEMKGMKVAKKDLILGGIYLDSNNVEVTYLGEFDEYAYYHHYLVGKGLWFHVPNNWRVTTVKPIASIKKFTGRVVDNYADLMLILEKCDQYKPTTIATKEYVEVTVDALNKKVDKSRYSQHFTFYILENKKYKKIYVLGDHNYDYNTRQEMRTFAVSRTRKNYYDETGNNKYNSTEELLNAYTFYEEVITKDGKQIK